MPAAATPAAAITATTIVRFKVRCRSSSFRLASALSMSGGAPVDFREPFLFPELRLERATIFTRHASRSLQIVHILGDGECPCAPRAIASCIKPLGARQGRRKIRLCPLLGPFDRARRWLAIDLRADRLRGKRSGVRLPCGLSHREFELGDFDTAGAGVRRADAQAQGGQKEDCCNSSNHNVLQKDTGVG
jgi:hypothetical protein